MFFVSGFHLQEVWAKVLGNDGDYSAGFLYQTHLSQGNFATADNHNVAAFKIME
jgi:hypothetical protein